MICTPHWGATETGAAVLRRGGNAIEALVAASAALAVLYPHFCGLGGDAIWMTADASGDVRTFSAIGQAAIDARPTSPIPLRGGASALTTAGLVDSWDAVRSFSESSWGGRERLRTLLEPAIEIASEGFPVSRSQQFWFARRAGEMAEWPGFRDLFVGEGVQRQPQLAGSLRIVADQGARALYEGELAARIAKGLADAGSPLTQHDLSKTRTLRETPLSLTYRDLTLFAPPPPTQGITTLAIMGVLNALPMKDFAFDGADYYHHLVEAVKQAFLDRSEICDPHFAAKDDLVHRLLDARRIAAKAAAINPACALPWPQPLQTGDTALLAAVDAEGRCASLLQSIYFDWGSGVVAGDTGILWQNRGAAFSVDSASVNRIEPGKRPFYTLNPGIARCNGRPRLLYGTQGADGQPQTLSLLLSLVADHGLDPLAALSRPRFLLGRTFSDSRDSLKVEANLGVRAISGLARLGHEVSEIDAFSQLAGQAGLISINPDGRVEGAHDPRSDGGALGV